MSASDKTKGLYKVKYWLIQQGPIFNPALLQQEAQFYWESTPTLEVIKEVVRIPEFIRKRHYDFCKDCPIFVETIRKPKQES